MNHPSKSRMLEMLNGIYPELILFRRALHQEPEVGWEEVETTSKIIRFLEKEGHISIRKPLDTGLVCDLLYEKDAPFIALRADIDALPMQDLKSVTYRSRRDGVCHACGHDIHTAVMAGVALFFQKSGITLPFNLRIIFQPAEEPIPSGAPKMIQHGVMENVIEIWTMHVDPDMPLGTVSLTPGWVNAQSIKLQWGISGQGGHSARPHLTINPIEAGAQLISKTMHRMRHFQINSRSNFAFAFTQFTGGSAYNAIPDSAEISGTLRITDTETRREIEHILAEINQEIESEKGTDIELTVNAGAPPVINDQWIMDRFNRNLPDEYGMEFRVEKDKRSMGGEDFSWYQEKAPGALVKFGTAVDENAPQVHTGYFDAPEEVIRFALLFFLHQLLKLDKKGIKNIN